MLDLRRRHLPSVSGLDGDGDGDGAAEGGFHVGDDACVVWCYCLVLANTSYFVCINPNWQYWRNDRFTMGEEGFKISVDNRVQQDHRMFEDWVGTERNKELN